MSAILEFFTSINPTTSEFANKIIQALSFELAIFLAIPLIGILINSIVVKGIRRVFTKILGPAEVFFSNYVLFIGVVIHELSHALFALISGAKIVEIALFKPEGDMNGHVTIQTRGNAFIRAFQNSFSACAPVVVGSILLLLLIASKVFPTLTVAWQWALVIYLFISILFHMNMSSADLKCYFKGTIQVLILLLPICLLIMFLSK